MDHTQAYFHWFAKTHAHVHLCRCQPACIEQSEKTVCPCEDEGRTMQRKDGGSNAALPDSKSCSNGWRRRARGCQVLWEQATNTRYLQPPLTEKGLYFRFRDPENRTRARKLSTRRAPLATSFCENRTPGSENPTLPMAGSCSRSAGLRGG